MAAPGDADQESNGRYLRDSEIMAHINRAIVAVHSSSPNWMVRDFCCDFS